VAQVLATRRSREQLQGSLEDAELKRRMDSATSPSQVERPGACPDCTLEVHCRDCQTTRVAGATYRDGHVLVLLAQTGPAQTGPARSGDSLADADIVVSTSGPGGQIGSFESAAEGGATVISFDARDLASATPRDQARMPFDVSASVMRSEVVNGPWRIDQNGGQR
jgi:xanthine/CO dehydrogenase XdhC/CoxF family maturation factor